MEYRRQHYPNDLQCVFITNENENARHTYRQVIEVDQGSLAPLGFLLSKLTLCNRNREFSRYTVFRKIQRVQLQQKSLKTGSEQREGSLAGY